MKTFLKDDQSLSENDRIEITRFLSRYPALTKAAEERLAKIHADIAKVVVANELGYATTSTVAGGRKEAIGITYFLDVINDLATRKVLPGEGDSGNARGPGG